MAKSSTKKLTGLRAGSVAMFEGTFAAIVGLGVAILYSLSNTVELAKSTSSVLTGLAFGVTTGVVAIIVVPLVYFALGWVVGYVHGFVFNLVAGASGGIDLHLED